MPEQEIKSFKILDWIIISFFVIFILSLSNSIFINQIGYFGALLFILVKAFLTKKNPFSRTGLELAFALYMIAEILSLIFSDYKAEAFHNFTKRAMLIPIVYTTIVVTANLKTGKNYFKLFIAGSLITGAVYLLVSVQYYLNNQYVIKQSGPALIQNPITTSEIISFAVLFLFAFIINEKTGWKAKLLLYSGFIVSALTLIATYKRTGWMGVAVGIVLILIIKRKWKILAPIFLAGIILFFLDKNISQVNVYDFRGTGAKKLFSLDTEGRPWSVTNADSIFIVSDYENGLLLFNDSVLVKKIETPAPAVMSLNIDDSLLIVRLIDTRFLVFKKQDEDYHQINEILPPGDTQDFAVFGKSLYVLDNDSGLTYYQSITNQSVVVRFPEIDDYKWMFIDSLYFYFISDLHGMVVYSKDEELPDEKILEMKNFNLSRAYLFRNNLLIGNTDGLSSYSIKGNSLVLNENLKNIINIHRFADNSDTLIVLTSDGYVYKYMLDNFNSLKLLASDKVSPMPTYFSYFDGNLYCTYINRGRLLSFVDPYLSQNFTRLALWRGGLEIFKDYPLFGVGDIDLAKYYVKYKRPSDKEIHGHLHNNYFHFLATLGLIGLLALIYLFVMIIVIISKIYKSTKGKPFIASYSLGALASFVSILFAGLSELNFWDQEIATLIYFTVGLNIALFIRYKEESEK